MRVTKIAMAMVVLLGFCFVASGQQIGKYVPITAGSDEDHAIRDINAATDPAQKLALIDKFASGLGQGKMESVADELYVNYYMSQKNYAKTYEYGDKLFAIDPDNLLNAVSLVRAASEEGNTDKLLGYGEKSSALLQRFSSSAAPSGISEDQWKQQKASALQSNADNIHYIEYAVYTGVLQTKDATKRAGQLSKFAELFPSSNYANQALGVAASSYQEVQNVPKMLEVANGLIAKDPNNLGMLLLLANYYGEKGEQLDKAEAYAKKAASLTDTVGKPEGAADDQWKQQMTLQKGIALSALGRVGVQKKDYSAAVQNFLAAAPMLKSNDASYAGNQFWLGYAYLSLKKLPEAKQALTDAASVNSPYKQPALDKLKTLPAKAPVARKRAS